MLLEPHGAVAWRGFLDWQAQESLNGLPAVILETATPAKFQQEIEKNMGWSPDVPPVMAAAIQQPEDIDRMGADYDRFKKHLLAKHA